VDSEKSGNDAVMSYDVLNAIFNEINGLQIAFRTFRTFRT